jgi:tRNA(Met) C34 N-acetyltransferase TmcA
MLATTFPPVLDRYAPGDPVESWLHSVLCLDSATHLPRPPAKLPHPSSCELFYVERDTLFSFHKASEAFLQRVSIGQGGFFAGVLVSSMCTLLV